MRVLKILIIVLFILKVEARQFKTVQLYTDDERCNEIGICSDMNYEDRNVEVIFKHKPKIRFTSYTTYNVKEERKEYFTLTFVNSKFSNIPSKLFEAFDIHELDFRNCSLKSLNKKDFENADALNILLLSNNLLNDIPKETFSLAKNLTFLLMDSNRINVLYKESFKNLEYLKYLDLHSNLIETLPSYIFAYLPELQQINLAENRLKIIERDIFYYNTLLFSINLQQNYLEEIQDYAFQNMELKYLDISYNPRLEVFESTNIRVDNLWAKYCGLKRINIYGQVIQADFQHNSIKELYFTHDEYLESLRLKNNDLEQLSSITGATNLRILDVSHNPLLKDLNNLNELYALERLDVSNCSLSEIPLQILVNADNLRTLNISFNHIQEINPLHFKYLYKLSQLYLHHNNWNCYNLKLIMDLLIKPYRISYTREEERENIENFRGDYIRGIRCLNPEDFENEKDYYMDSNADMEAKYNVLNFEKVEDLEKLQEDLKIVMDIYEEKFSLIMNNLEELDIRLRKFELFNDNKALWQKASIAF